MLSQNQEPAAQVPAEGVAPPVAVSRDDEEAVQALMRVIQATPDFGMLDDSAAEFLTSPQFLTSPLETPWEDFIPTPALGDNLEFSPDILTSPAMDFDASSFGEMSLFGDMPLFGDEAAAAYKQPVPAPKPAPATVAAPTDFHGLFTMLSPATPSLDPSSLNTSPALLDAHSFAPTPGSPANTRRKPQPTGTRKNVTPDSLIPLDAPIQPRNYLTPSATSRKDVPATFARKRSRTSAGLDAEDDGPMPTIPLDATEEEAIKIKRLQNTLAARRSRKRKLEYQKQLEDELDVERAAKEAWRERARMLESLLVSHGVEAPAQGPALL